MKKVLIFVAVLFGLTQAVKAETYDFEIDNKTYQKSGLKGVFPQLYIYNDQGELQFINFSLTRSIKKELNGSMDNAIERPSSEKLKVLLTEKYDFKFNNKTLVLITDADAEQYCPPCAKQEKINNAVIKKLSDDNLDYVILRNKVDGERTFEMLSEEEFKRRYGKVDSSPNE